MSIYDPCPYGYRVPNNGSWTGFPSTTWTINTLNEGAVWSSWWPAAGYRAVASGALGCVGRYGYYWSSTRCPLAYVSYNFAFEYNGLVHHVNHQLRGDGFIVRCVQEEAATHPKTAINDYLTHAYEN